MAARRSLDETRTMLLDTGAQIVIDSGVQITLDQVNLMDVSRAAGLKTSGSAYKIWSTQEAFRTDLMRHLFEIAAPNPEAMDELASALEAHPDDLPSFRTLIRTFGNDATEDPGGQMPITVYFALLLTAGHDPILAEKLNASDHTLFESYARIYDAAVRHYDREFVEPFDATSLTVALAALAEGFSIRGLATPELVAEPLLRRTGPDGSEEAWHLFTCAAEAIINTFTRSGATTPGED